MSKNRNCSVRVGNNLEGYDTFGQTSNNSVLRSTLKQRMQLLKITILDYKTS